MPKDNKDDTYQLVEIPTQTELAIQTPEGETWTIPKALVEILNKLDAITNRLK